MKRSQARAASPLSTAMFCLAALALLAAPPAAAEGDAAAEKASEPTAATKAPEAVAPIALVITTTKGAIEVEIYPDRAPASVKNFLAYVDDGHYGGTIFHRVIEKFMIQGGGFGTDKVQKPTKAPIKNEADNGLKNERGTLAMARTQVVDSATSQFFINTVDNAFLDFKSATPRGYGYAVFGRVTEGMEVLDAIATTPTRNAGGAFANAPVEAVVIETIARKAP